MKVLALSPHTDDIELGAGGYLTKLHEQGHDIFSVIFSDCSNHWDLPLREECANSLTLINSNPVFADLPAREFDRQVVLDLMITTRETIKPDLVLLPSSSDIHQDHVVIHAEGVRAFSRECSVLGYDLHWNCRGFNPNYFIELQEKHVNGKLKMLRNYKSQVRLHRPYFDEVLIRGLARSRGLQIKKEYAEAFEVITLVE